MTVQLRVPDMACEACAKTITQAILAIDESASVKADTKTKEVIVETQASAASVKNAIAEVGYHPD
jgi:copper chaperone